MIKYKFCILNCGLENNSNRWIKSCENLDQAYETIDITHNDWLQKAIDSDADCFLLKPPGNLSYAKHMYDEKIYILSKVLNKSIYPGYQESYIYENKRLLSYFLQAMNIPHPKTYVFYYKNEAYSFANKCRYPIVGKTNIGASGSGVSIIKSEKELKKYIKTAFSTGIERRKGPNRKTGNVGSWITKAIKSPKYLIKKIKKYKRRAEDKQKYFVILQEYIPHDFEWRAVKIGDSYFAHKKTKIGKMASGTKDKIYDKPPIDLLDFIRNISNKTNFYSQAIDIFKDNNKGYLVNEIQTIFGQSDDFQMKVNDKIGRYIYRDEWIFEEGDFNTNESYDLRLKHAIKLLNNREL